MSLTKENLRLIVPATTGALVGLTLRIYKQPSEVAFVLAIVAFLLVSPAVNFAIQFTEERAEQQEDSDADISEEEESEPEPVAKKPKKKKKSRYAARRLYREENKDAIEAAKLARQKAREEAAKQEAAAKAAAEAEAAAEAATTKKKKKKKKRKGKKKAADDAAAAAPEADKKEESEEEWQTVTSSRKSASSSASADGEDAPAGPKDIRSEIRVEPRAFGSIIGKGGENLKLIQEATGARINMPKKGMMHSDIITVTGQPTAVEQAKTAIEQLARSGYSTLTHPDFEEAIIEVDRRYHGAVMGNGGANIREIQKASGTRVNMPKKGSDPKSKEGREISIVGTHAGIQLAKKSIRELVSKGFSELTHPNWVRQEIPFPSELVRNLVGKGGETIRLLQVRYDVQINTPAPNAIPSFVTLLGPADNVARAEVEVRNLAIMDDAEIDPCWGGMEAGFDLSHLNAW